MTAPTTAMVLAAGLGTRMKPLTDTCPKPLIMVGGKTLLDHLLDRLIAAGVTRAVINVHAHADMMEAHAKKRRDIEVLISDERARLLETGGGVKKARALLGETPIWVANTDYVWIEDGASALDQVSALWDPTKMDAAVIVIPKARTSGFDTPGDFFADGDGTLTFRGDAPEAPLHCFGIEIIDPTILYRWHEEAFSQKFALWLPACGERRMFGVSPPGFWMQVGDPQALLDAEARLTQSNMPLSSGIGIS
jgi:N-acetyl-alpha-D-muramate 1-phosphate uridylyltransferase